MVAPSLLLSKPGRLPSPGCPPLSSSHIRLLKETAIKTCTDLLSQSKLDGRNNTKVLWRPLPFGTEPGLAYYVGDVPTANSSMHYMCCVTTVRATLDEVMELLSGEEQSTMGEDAYELLEADIVKSKHLLTLKHLDRLKISLRWFAIDSSSTYVPLRDFVVLQFQNEVRVRGRNGWALSLHSVDLPGFPSYKTSHGLVRGGMYRSGYVVVETDTPGAVQVTHMVQIDFKGHVPQEDVESMLRRRVGNIGHLEAFFTKLTLVARIVSNMESARVSNLDKVKVCAMCSRKFGFLTRKITCRLCGDIVCSECSQAKDLQIPITGLKRVDICNVCNVNEECATNRRSFVRQYESRQGHHNHRRASRRTANDSLLSVDDESHDPYMQIMRGKQTKPQPPASHTPMYSFLEDHDSDDGYASKHPPTHYAAVSPVGSTAAVVGATLWQASRLRDASCTSRSVSSFESTSPDNFWAKPKQTLMQTFFNTPQLTEEEAERMKRLGRDVCTQVAYAARRADTGTVAVRWRSIGVENKVELFAGEDPLPEQEKFLSYMCGVTSVHATIDQVADLFNGDHMSQTHGLPPSAEFTRQFNQDLASYQTLKYLRQRTEKYPRHSVSIKWFLMESPSMASKPRDYVYLESQEDIMDAKRNKRGWVCAMHSIDLPSAPSLERTHDIVRGSLYRSGFVFTETETPGVLEAIYLLQIDFKGSLPMHLRQAIMKQRLGCLRAIDDHFLRRPTAALLPAAQSMSYPGPSKGVTLLGDIHLKSKHGVSTCACCAGGFGFLKKKHNCRVCGEVVCSSCCTQQRPSAPVEGIKKYHICSLCSVDNRPPAPANNGVHGRSRSGHELYQNPASQGAAAPHSRSALSSSNMRSPNSGPPGPFPSRLQQPNLPRSTMAKPMQADAFLEDDPYAMRLRMPEHMVRKPSYRESGAYPLMPLSRPSGYGGPPRPYEHDLGVGSEYPPAGNFNRHSTYFPPARPDSRESFVNERESVLDLYDEVGTSVSRYVPPPPARVPRAGPRPTQVQYLPRSGEATTIDLRDLNNASDVLAQLNNQRSGESTVRLEIIQGGGDDGPEDDYDVSLARRPRDYYPPSASGRFRAPPHAAPRWPMDRQRFDPMQMRFDNIIASTANLVAPPAVPEASPSTALAAIPAGSVYKGSRYRIKETRYYATTPDATPDEYVADERDSIVVDMPSQPAAAGGNRLGNGSSPTAVAVSKFLDQDIDMFLQPMDKKSGGPLQLEQAPAKDAPPNFDHNASIEDLLGPLRSAPSGNNNAEDDSVAYLTALLMERLRVANASEREHIKEQLRAAVQEPTH
ncbi:hypothetical protein ACHHYP_09251 [Achlya hypogyna]|uniref:FYVE-type domain-containing protein n=1 Tax=Achlya hypogyna TaxID=1202772 RepID=A0A1V9ZJQ0_ACHHY|nr:hypothetical protein ACHHYP_09251 [Achlya hypogyna]